MKLTAECFFCSFFSFLLSIGILVWFVDFLLVHRIYYVRDLFEIFRTAVSPVSSINDHCKELLFHRNEVKCLPNLFIIGVSKSGTTSLVSYLSQLKDVSFIQRGITKKKDKHYEIHRFDRSSYERSWKWLEFYHEWSSSVPISSSSSSSTSSLVLHYTPHYFYAPVVPFEMKKFYPSSLLHSPWENEISSPGREGRFVVLLRNPLDRMISSYWFKKSHLFHSVDQGSMDEFLITINNQQQKRYEVFSSLVFSLTLLAASWVFYLSFWFPFSCCSITFSFSVSLSLPQI
jgi:hypothetical protein